MMEKSKPEYTLIVCGECKEIMFGEEGDNDTLLEHVVEAHNRALSPDIFSKESLEEAERTGFPSKLLDRATPYMERGPEPRRATPYMERGPAHGRAMARAWLDQTPGKGVLEILYNGDPSHPGNGRVNTLREKAASAVGALLNSPRGLSELEIPENLKAPVACWHHSIYRHRYPREALRMGPNGCTVCCKEKECQACCQADSEYAIMP